MIPFVHRLGRLSTVVRVIRITVSEMFRGIASSRTTGLAATGGDSSQMWSAIGKSVAYSHRSGTPWIARSAGLRSHSSSCNRSVEQLHELPSRTKVILRSYEPRTARAQAGHSTTVAVPASEFDATLAELLQVRNSLADRVSATFTTLGFFFSMLLGYGLPIRFRVRFVPLRVF